MDLDSQVSALGDALQRVGEAATMRDNQSGSASSYEANVFPALHVIDGWYRNRHTWKTWDPWALKAVMEKVRENHALPIV